MNSKFNKLFNLIMEDINADKVQEDFKLQQEDPEFYKALTEFKRNGLQSSYKTKRYLATNQKTPTDILLQLADDDDFGVTKDSWWSNIPIKQFVRQRKNLPTEVVQKFSQSDTWQDRYYGAAKNSNLSDDMIQKLSNDKKMWVRFQVAKKTNSLETMRKLSDDRSYKVRQNLAKNPNLPVELMEKLSNDENMNVRHELIINKNVPLNILQKLSNDKDYLVRCKLVSSRRCTPEIFKKFIDDNDMQVLEAIVYSNSAPLNFKIQALQKLGNDINPHNRWIAATDKNTPIQLLQKLANDEDQDVRGVAELTLKNIKKN